MGGGGERGARVLNGGGGQVIKNRAKRAERLVAGGVQALIQGPAFFLVGSRGKAPAGVQGGGAPGSSRVLAVYRPLRTALLLTNYEGKNS